MLTRSLCSLVLLVSSGAFAAPGDVVAPSLFLPDGSGTPPGYHLRAGFNADSQLQAFTFGVFGSTIHARVVLLISVDQWTDANGFERYAVRSGGTPITALIPFNGQPLTAPRTTLPFSGDSAFITFSTASEDLNQFSTSGSVYGLPLYTVFPQGYGEIRVRAGDVSNAPGTVYEDRFGPGSSLEILDLGFYQVIEGQLLGPAEGGTDPNSNPDTQALIELLEQLLDSEEDTRALLDELLRDPNTETPYLALILQSLDVGLDETNDLLDRLLTAQEATTLTIGQIGQILTGGSPGEAPDGYALGQAFTSQLDLIQPVEPYFIDDRALPASGLSDQFSIIVNPNDWNINIGPPMQWPVMVLNIDLTWAAPFVSIVRSFMLLASGMWGAMRIWQELRKY